MEAAFATGRGRVENGLCCALLFLLSFCFQNCPTETSQDVMISALLKAVLQPSNPCVIKPER